MPHEQLEKYLFRQILKRRLIEVSIAVILLTIGFVCNHFYETSAQIVHYDSPFENYTRKVYDESYIPFIIAGMTGGVVCFYIVLMDLLLSKYKTVQKGQQYLTLYRGLIFNSVYVDGIEKGRTIPMPHVNMVEVWLADRVRATVHFTASLLNIAHISFSDHTATMEV